MTAPRRLRLIVAALLLVSAACAGRPYETLDDNGEPLRARFNADAGKTRVVMLVAPT